MAHSYSHLFGCRRPACASSPSTDRGAGPTWRRCCSRGRSSRASRSRCSTTAGCGATSPTSTTSSKAWCACSRGRRRPTRRAARRTRSTTSATTRRSSSTTFIATLERLLGRTAIRDYAADAAGRRAGDVRVDRPAARADRLRAAHAARRRARALRRVVSRLLPAPERGARRRAGKIAPSHAPLAPSIALTPHDPRHRRRRLHRRQLRARLARATRRAGRQPRQADLRRQPRQPRRSLQRRSAPRVRARRHRRSRALVGALLREHRPRAIVNFAAETHVDRSIHGPAAFIETNVVGTFDAARRGARTGGRRCRPASARAFRFLHVSTDEVYGSLAPDATRRSRETTPYAPNSPYSASKAASDHLVRAYHHTYGLPTLTTNCSNNYGPRQFPEKLIPLMIVNALAGKPLPVYGDGQNVRDWLYVGDHCAAIRAVLARGRPGETYNIGGNAEMTNLDVVRDALPRARRARSRAATTRRSITFVTRPARPRPPLRDRRRARSSASSAGRRRRRSRPACAQTVALVSRQPRRGSTRVTSGAYQKWIVAAVRDRA